MTQRHIRRAAVLAAGAMLPLAWLTQGAEAAATAAAVQTLCSALPQ